MAVRDTDTFTYSNGNLATVSSAKWTKLSSFPDPVVTSNTLTGTASADAVAVITSWPWSTTDHYSEATITSAVSDEGGLTVRSDAAGTFYCADLNGLGIQIYKVIATAFTSLTSGGTSAINNLIRLDMQGTTIQASKNGVVALTVTLESSIASGKPGIQPFNTNCRWDGWAAGDFLSGTIAYRTKRRPFPFKPGSDRYGRF